MNDIGVAFIGCGLVAHMHARAVKACPGARLVGVFDVRPAQARKIGRQYGCRVYRRVEDLLTDPHVAAVHVLPMSSLQLPFPSHALVPVQVAAA